MRMYVDDSAAIPVQSYVSVDEKPKIKRFNFSKLEELKDHIEKSSFVPIDINCFPLYEIELLCLDNGPITLFLKIHHHLLTVIH